MPFVSIARAEQLPRVIAKYSKVGQFRKMVKAESRVAASWAKRPAGAGASGTGALKIKVNTAAVPGVRPMSAGGKAA